jgi:hypothetical protein
MNLKENIDIDQLIPEGWEFREEYMEQALAALKHQQRRAKRKKIIGWSSAAAAILVVGSMLLQVCSSKNYLDKTTQTQLASKDSKNETTLRSPSATEVESTVETTKSLEIHSAKAAASSPIPTISTRETAKTANAFTEAVGPDNQMRSAKDIRRGSNRTPIKSSTSKKAEKSSPVSTLNSTAFNPTSNQLPPRDAEIDDSSAQLQGESNSPAPIWSNALWIATKEGQFAPPYSALKPSFHMGFGPRHSWSAIAGNAMWADYGRTQNKMNFQPIVGLGYRYRLTSKWGLTAQLLYSSIKDPGAVFNQTQIYYDYQQLQTTATIRTNRLHYGNLNLAAKYGINTMWSASLGIAAAIKITGHNTIERTGFNQLATQQKAMGYVSGFRRLNIGLTAALDRRLNSRAALGIQYVLGLSDVSKDSIFSEKVYHSNSQLNLILTYRIQ